MNPAALCLNIHRFLKAVDGLPFPMTMSKLAFLACCDGKPRGTRSVALLMGTTQAAASIALETMRDGGLLKREERYGGLYSITGTGRWMLDMFAQAARGNTTYESPTKERSIQGAEEERPDSGEVLPMPFSGEPETHGAPPPCFPQGCSPI